ncbi:MAG: DegT/DnrJ/EryC1/StrS family aminotransferase [Pirellulales bacterium]|nr:DegT/DnrJ/EryC1/StrS family aminotransferase [Pirellulales bacterium]
MIPLCDLKRQYQALKDQFDAAFAEVAAGAHYILGPNVKQLEADVAKLCECRFGVGTANGTDSLHLALRALRIGPGDEVITTPFTFVATTEAIGIVGATPVLVDVDPKTFNLDPAAVEAAITPKTRAILPVHLYGQPCDMDAIMRLAQEHDLHVVEDGAQSLGARYRGRPVGSFGAAGCLSFFPSKNLGAMGDAGMVLSNDEELAGRVEMLRRHGGQVKYYHAELGLNSRLDELQAALLRVKLPYLERWVELRRQHAYRYNTLLADVDEVVCPHELTETGPVVPLGEPPAGDGQLVHAAYHQYTVLVDNRDAVAAHLKEAGVGHAIYYPVPLHLQEVHAGLGYQPGSLPHAEAAAARCLSLPMFPELRPEEIEEVVRVLKEAIVAAK